jgi:hypothetical protein
VPTTIDLNTQSAKGFFLHPPLTCVPTSLRTFSNHESALSTTSLRTCPYTPSDGVWFDLFSVPRVSTPSPVLWKLALPVFSCARPEAAYQGSCSTRLYGNQITADCHPFAPSSQDLSRFPIFLLSQPCAIFHPYTYYKGTPKSISSSSGWNRCRDQQRLFGTSSATFETRVRLQLNT